jgi:hypothetical protein
VSQTGTEITICADGSLCCGFRNKNCCELGIGVWLVDGKVYEHDVKPTISETTAPRSNASLGSRPWEAQPARETTSAPGAVADSRKLQQIALGVGLGVGLPLLIALLGIAVYIRRKSTKSTAETNVNIADTSDSAAVHPPAAEIMTSEKQPGVLDIEKVAELQAEETAVELPEVESPLHELDSKEMKLDTKKLIV